MFDDESEEFIMTRNDEQLCQMVLNLIMSKRVLFVICKNESSACDLIESIKSFVEGLKTTILLQISIYDFM